MHVASLSRLHRGRQMATAILSLEHCLRTDAIDAPGARVAEREPKEAEGEPNLHEVFWCHFKILFSFHSNHPGSGFPKF